MQQKADLNINNAIWQLCIKNNFPSLFTRVGLWFFFFSLYLFLRKCCLVFFSLWCLYKLTEPISGNLQKLFKHNITMLQSINHCQKPRQRTMGLKCHPKEYKLINMIFKYIDKINKHTHIRSRDHWWCWMDGQKDSLIIKWPKLYSILENISNISYTYAPLHLNPMYCLCFCSAAVL